MTSLFNVSAIWGKVKIFWVILKVVLLEEISKFLARGKLDTAWTVDINVPPPSLLAVLPLLQLPEPAVGQRVV